MPELDNTHDTIDSRQIIERIEELQDMRDDAGNGIGVWENDDQDELDMLNRLSGSGSTVSGWDHGVTLVRESYFRDYAIEYISEVNEAALSAARNAGLVIDWDATARDLKTNFTSIEWDGITYYTNG
jgi:hypothetical protein